MGKLSSALGKKYEENRLSVLTRQFELGNHTFKVRIPAVNELEAIYNYYKSPNEEKVEEAKTTFKCESCEKVHPLEKAIRCELCNINDESASSEDEEAEDSSASAKEEDEIVEKASLDSWDGKIKHLFCKKCTRKCDACEERGCKECVTFACCDCDYNMCYECRNNEVDCGCYGHCYSCGTDIDRGSDGWPCGECEKWYCHGCRDCDNPCKECGPESESESEEDDEAEEPVSSSVEVEGSKE